MAARQRRAVQAIEFKPVAARRKTMWGRPASFAFTKGLSQVPLSDSEVLVASHHLPIAIDGARDALRVVALTSPRFQQTPVLSPGGQWARGYMPIALRCLPFRLMVGRSGEEVLEVATNIDEQPESQLPMFAENGALAPAVGRALALLRRLEEGQLALQRAAEKLMIADVLAPFQLARLPPGHAAQREFLTVDQNRFAALTPARAGLLVKDGFLPVDLAMACVFSQRLMTTLIALATARGDGQFEPLADWDDFTAVEQVDVKLDDSELFPFEQFAATP